MKQMIVAMMVLMALAACDSQPQTPKQQQFSSIEWDVVAASDTTAQRVMKNSNLIFMR